MTARYARPQPNVVAQGKQLRIKIGRIRRRDGPADCRATKFKFPWEGHCVFRLRTLTGWATMV